MAETDLGRYLRVIWRWRWLILLAMVLAASASYYTVRTVPRIYRTSTVLMVGEDTANPTVRPEDQQVAQRALLSYMGMVRRQPVLEATVDTLKLTVNWRTLQDQVVAVRVEGSNLIEIRVVDTSPTRVRAIADELARQLIMQSPTLSNVQQNEERRRFIQQQLAVLQANIQQSEAELDEKRAALAQESSARGVLELQDEIQALETKIDGWRNSYVVLLPALAQSRGPTNLTVVEPAYVPTEPVSPNVPMTVVLAVVVGALLASTVALILEFVDDTFRNPDDVARSLGLPVVGAIRRSRRLNHPKQRLIAWHEPLSPLAESFRMVRTFAELSGAHELSSLVFLVTSPGLGEGKSLTSANLAISFAQAGRRTILIDADLRQPSVHRFFGLPNGHGLTPILAELPADIGELDQHLEAALVTTKLPTLRLLLSGPVPLNPAELLGSSLMARVIARLRDQSDVLILDSPPVLPVADATILATHGVRVILVVEEGKTRARAARRALESLRRAEAMVIGVVVNRVRTAQMGYYPYQSKVAKSADQHSRPDLGLIRRN